MRPGHFWACELGDADGKGSPILHEYTKKSEYFTLKNGDKVLALFIWYSYWASNLYYAYKVFGDANLPWKL